MARFERESRIGSGGFGEVWRCRRVGDNQLYAQKRLKDGADPADVSRFSREVRLLKSMNHPNIVKVIAMRLRAEPYYYVMPLYAHSLHDELASIRGDDSRIDTVFGQVLDAMEYAHAQGCLHRDLKLENILMNDDTDVVVSDFGLGRNVDAESIRQTMTGDQFGTPGYMAPEQAQNAKAADERSDVYSLGSLIYHLYTGRHPYGGIHYANLPPRIEAVVRRCTEVDPDRRFKSVTALKAAWNAIQNRVSVASQRSRLEQLIGVLATATTVSKEDAEFLVDELLARTDDTDLLHEAVIKVTSEAWTAIYKMEPDSVRRIMELFSRFTADTVWGFDYTDRIADKCSALYTSLEDFQIRAHLVACVFEVGIEHNRWHVMSTAGKLLKQHKQPGETIPVVAALERFQLEYRLRAVDYIEPLTDLESDLRVLFRAEP